MFVGEAPGFHEARQGLPFVGASGKFLDTLLNGVGLRRGDIFIENRRGDPCLQAGEEAPSSFNT
jgi:uracil-DNA glycosylase family 4